jgi:hypothetical protein
MKNLSKNTLKMAFAALLCGILTSNAAFGAPTSKQISDFKETLQDIRSKIAVKGSNLFNGELRADFTWAQKVDATPRGFFRNGESFSRMITPAFMMRKGTFRVNRLKDVATAVSNNNVEQLDIIQLLASINDMVKTVQLAEVSQENKTLANQPMYNQNIIPFLRECRNTLFQAALPVLNALDNLNAPHAAYVAGLQKTLTVSEARKNAREQGQLNIDTDINTRDRIESDLMHFTETMQQFKLDAIAQKDGQMKKHSNDDDEDNDASRSIKKAHYSDNNNNNNAQ